MSNWLKMFKFQLLVKMHKPAEMYYKGRLWRYYPGSDIEKHHAQIPQSTQAGDIDNG